jgi:NDP-sugar pyrophosphorylase family protein
VRAGKLRCAVLLVGGLGTRLRPLTYLRPKPLLPVVNLPLVGHQLRWLARNGVERAVLAAGYKADLVLQELAKEDWGLEVRVIAEPEPRDTAGALKLAAADLGEPFLATNGDVIVDAALAPMWQAHQAAHAMVTILLRRVPDVSPYGLVCCDNDGRVYAFLEKQSTDPTGKQTVNAGVYICEPEALQYVPDGEPCSLERDLFPLLIAQGHLLRGYLPGEAYYWIDVGRPETYRQANCDLLGGAVAWCGPEVAPTAVIDTSATLKPPVAIASGAVVQRGATVGPYAVLGSQATVHCGAAVAFSILWEGACVESGATVEESVVATGATVAAGAHLHATVVMPS